VRTQISRLNLGSKKARRAGGRGYERSRNSQAAHSAGVKVIVDGDDLVIEAISPPPRSVLDALRAWKPEIIKTRRNERRAVIAWINDHFEASPLGECAYCGGVTRTGDPFIALFVGEDRREIHASCHPAWLAQQEADARAALEIETPDEGGRHRGKSITAESGQTPQD
jgi:hypothetical protein